MTLRIGRAFEISSRKPFPQASQGVFRNRRVPVYERLMQVAITNTFYLPPAHKSKGKDLEDECPDFLIIPTPSTQALMRRLGLLFRRGPAGFSIAYDEANPEPLIDYLRRQGRRREEQLRLAENENICANKPSTDLYWTRLSFTLVLTNPEFANFTGCVPIDKNPCSNQFYFTNQRAHQDAAGRVLLHQPHPVTQAPFVDAILCGEHQNYLQVAPAKFAAPVPLSVNEVEVQDIAGTPVMRASRWNLNAQRVPRPSNEIFLDFSQLPEDMYTICWPGGNLRVLYTTAAPIPLCFMDLLLSNPSGGNCEPPPFATIETEGYEPTREGTGSSGVYPVDKLDTDNPEIRPVHYQLSFRARSTRWVYYVIQQPQGHYKDLRILPYGNHTTTRFRRSRELIPVGQGVKAQRFVSHQLIELRQDSGQRFELQGIRGEDLEPSSLVKPLPVASAQQLFSGPVPPVDAGFDQAAGDSEYSEIYVYI